MPANGRRDLIRRLKVKQENLIWIIVFKYSVCTAHFGYNNQPVMCVCSESHTKHKDTFYNRQAHLSRSFGSHETYFSGNAVVWVLWAWWTWTINTIFFLFVELIIWRICCDIIFSPWAPIWYNFLLHTIYVAYSLYIKKIRGLSPRANYTDRAAAAGRRS